jgi:hypothetical protein
MGGVSRDAVSTRKGDSSNHSRIAKGVIYESSGDNWHRQLPSQKVWSFTLLDL